MKSLSLSFTLSLTTITAALFAQPRQADVSNIKRKWQDIAYASVSPAEKLDIYLPDNDAGSFPVIISVHGGAFMFGDKADGQLTHMLEG